MARARRSRKRARRKRRRRRRGRGRSSANDLRRWGVAHIDHHNNGLPRAVPTVPKSLLPYKIKRKFTYLTHGDLSIVTTSTTDWHQFRANSCFDPDQTGVGETVNGWGIYRTDYELQRVRKAYFRVRLYMPKDEPLDTTSDHDLIRLSVYAAEYNQTIPATSVAMMDFLEQNTGAYMTKVFQIGNIEQNKGYVELSIPYKESAFWPKAFLKRADDSASTTTPDGLIHSTEASPSQTKAEYNLSPAAMFRVVLSPHESMVGFVTENRTFTAEYEIVYDCELSQPRQNNLGQQAA
jgi:hypothetical protein